MGIFDRLSTLIRSNINDLISRAENPEKMLNQLIVDMRTQLAKAKQQVAAAIADEKRLAAQVDQEKKAAEDWEKRAVLAVQEARDDLAKQALLRHNEHAQAALQLHDTWIKHREETDKLKVSLRQLNDRIEEAKRKKNILIARQKRAEAHKRIQETMSSIGDKSAFETFEKMAEQIEHEERKFIAVLCAVYLSAITDLLERRFGVKRWIGLASAVVATVAAVVGIGALLVPPVIDQTQALISGLPQTLTKIQNVLAAWAREYPVLFPTELANPASGLVGGLIDAAAGFLRGSILPYATAGGKLFIESASVVVMALYLARQPLLYRDGVLSLLPPKHRPLGAHVLDDAGATLRAWVVGQLLAMMILAALTALGLWALDVPYWLAFGIFTGLVAVVPFFGTLVSTLLPALFVIESGDWIRVVAVILLGVAVHVAEANLVVPRIMQHRVSLPPVLTIASVLIMGTLIGVAGLVVAVPVLAVTTVFVRHVVQGALYGDVGSLEPAVLRTTERRLGADRREPGVPTVRTKTSA